MEGDAAVIASVCWQRGQGNFELAANFGYSSRGSADPRESLRKRRISKLALTAHKVSLRFPLPVPSSSAGFGLRLDATVVCSFKVIVSVECCTFFNLR